MNQVALLGRLARDPEIKATANTTIANFTLAVDRPYSKEKEADFIRCVAFGKTAELIDQYCGKGRQIGITGRIQTGSYEDKNGKKVFTTDVVVERMDFVGSKQEGQQTSQADYSSVQEKEQNAAAGIPEGFHAYDEDDDFIPF